MLTRDNYLELDDDQLLGQCEVDTYKASGPGGQHRNKVSSAVRLRHKPTEIMAHGNDSRSQHENKRLALKRLRKNLAT
ncbi:MAG: peptide chain release factor family protein, partial [Phycisphaerae bacterium]